MNFSEYVAILPGNQDLLQKARLAKQITVLESELKLFQKENYKAASMLTDVSMSMDKARKSLTRLQADYAKLTAVTRFGPDGSLPNATKITLTSTPITTVKALGEYITRMDEKMNTKGGTKQLGTLHGFNLYVRTDSSYSVNGKPEKANVFFVKGDNLTYSYNNGYLTGRTPEIAARQFVRALEKIPSLMEHQREKIKNLSQQQKPLTDITAKPWGKRDKLQELKSELRPVEARWQSIGPEKAPEMRDQKINQPEKSVTKRQNQTIEIG